MKINFKALEWKHLENFKGGTGILKMQSYTDGTNKMLHLIFDPGVSLGVHTHTEDCEIFYIIGGTGTITDDGEAHVLQAGDCYYCPKGHSHGIVNDSDAPLELFAVLPAKQA